MTTTAIIEIQAEVDEEDLQEAIEHVLDSGILQEAIKAEAPSGVEIVSCMSRVARGLPIKAIPGHVLSTAIANTWHGGAWGRHPDHMATREQRAIELAEAMVEGLSREDILAIARKEVRLTGDTRSGLALERTQ